MTECKCNGSGWFVCGGTIELGCERAELDHYHMCSCQDEEKSDDQDSNAEEA